MHEAGAGVAKVLDRGDSIDACRVERWPPNALPEVGDPNVVAILGREHERVALLVDKLREVRCQDFLDRFGDHDGPRLMRFGGSVVESPSDLGHRLFDLKAIAKEVAARAP